jgi:hypothetical protein
MSIGLNRTVLMPQVPMLTPRRFMADTRPAGSWVSKAMYVLPLLESLRKLRYNDVLPLILASEVLNLLWVLRAQLLKLRVQDITNARLRMLANANTDIGCTYALGNKVIGQNLFNDSLAHDDSSGVANPATVC